MQQKQEECKACQLVKIVFVGPPCSGKSCLLFGYTNEYKSTIGVDVAVKQYEINGKIVKFQLWDISASMTFNNQSYDHCKNGQIVVAVYAANDKNSFKQCQDLAQKLVVQDKLKFDAKAAILATKIDLQRQVTKQQGEQAAQILRNSSVSDTQTYFQVSAKDEPNAIQRLCRGFYKILKDQNIKTIVQIDNEYKQAAPPQSPIIYEKAQPEVKKNTSNQKILKVLLMGGEKVGKSCMVQKFVNWQFLTDHISTIGVDFAIKIVQIDGYNVKLQIWDTAGAKKFQCITTSYIKGCKCIILVYDCSNRKSFEEIPEFVEQVTKFGQQNVCKYLVANKVDLPREVSKEEGEQLAQYYSFKYFQVSTLQHVNIDELFYEAADYLVKSQQ